MGWVYFIGLWVFAIVVCQLCKPSGRSHVVRDTSPGIQTDIPIYRPVSVLEEIANYIPTVPVRPDWFVSEWAKTLAPSPAEQLIINELEKYEIRWEREVSFRTLLAVSGWPLRFDFYLPDFGICIEYQGKEWHQSPERLSIDETKREFCKTNDLRLITYNSYHYYKMSYEISQLMYELNVSCAGIPYSTFG